jgi:hypothetical protein
MKAKRTFWWVREFSNISRETFNWLKQHGEQSLLEENAKKNFLTYKGESNKIKGKGKNVN